MKSINEPHKPNCGYLCSGNPPALPCDCGAVTQPRLELSLGHDGVALILRGLGRLDTDDGRKVDELGLKAELTKFLEIGSTSTVERQLRDLLAKKNMTSKLDDEHPLPFSDVLMVIRRALATDLTPEPNEKPEDAQLGIKCFGRFDDTRGVHHVIALAVADANKVTVGIVRAATRWAEPESGWPGELAMRSNRWSEHRQRYIAWAGKKADDRITFARKDVEAFAAIPRMLARVEGTTT